MGPEIIVILGGLALTFLRGSQGKESARDASEENENSTENTIVYTLKNSSPTPPERMDDSPEFSD
ncbi:MAG: hypothetical protein AAFY41_12365 [Bacteroidota bacterium]